MREKHEIPAVRDRDLRKILDQFGLKDKLDNDEIKCEHCSEIVTWKNLGAMKVRGKNLILFCNSTECSILY